MKKKPMLPMLRKKSYHVGQVFALSNNSTESFMLCQTGYDVYCLIAITGIDVGNRWVNPTRIDFLDNIPDDSPLWGSIGRKGWKKLFRNSEQCRRRSK